MSFENFNTYGQSPQTAFETLATQLFERYLRRTYGQDLIKFRVVNGDGGDGGIEAYGELKSGELLVVQAKCFFKPLEKTQINQIRDSVDTAFSLRKNITEYIICIPRTLGSLKMVRGAAGAGPQPSKNSEDQSIEDLNVYLKSTYPKTKFTWWFEQDLELQISESDNEGLHKFWFEKELITMNHLFKQYDQEKAAWFESRYLPELHGQGYIQTEIQKVLFSESFREELLKKLNVGIKLLESGIDLISRFSAKIEESNPLRIRLEILSENIQLNLAQIDPISVSIIEGSNVIPKFTLVPLNIDEDFLSEIRLINPTDRQIGPQARLLNILDYINDFEYAQMLDDISNDAIQTGRLIIGEPGTGKSHALINTVETRLTKEQYPGIIIRAKGTPCEDWTQILGKALDLQSWNHREILCALEALAIRADRREVDRLPAKEELKKEPTKIIICIDGLEEDTKHWDEWYARIRQSVELMRLYQRVRFVYTARTYFLNEAEMPKDVGFKFFLVPVEGDVTVNSVIDKYFDHFKIKVTPKSLIRGIDSLFALRLFCEKYRGKELTSNDEIITAEKKLLNAKVESLDVEFRKIVDAGSSRYPVRESIFALSEAFFSEGEIDHESLFDLFHKGSIAYLEKINVEKLIDHLVQNGILIKSEHASGKGPLDNIKVVYNITYQSIMESIMSEIYADQLMNGELSSLPAHLVEVATENKINPAETSLIHERIVQQIVTKLFNEKNLLIGRDRELSEGINEEIVQRLQLKALIDITAQAGELLKPKIDELFLKDYRSRHFVFENLIYPSAMTADKYFGAEYLHELLESQKSAFDRERTWLGYDSTMIGELDDSEDFEDFDLQGVIDIYGSGPLLLSEFALHNEHPLIFAWALSTLDQSFRARLRTALTRWAFQQPHEFLLLLRKIFPCNEPQIQEDLATITHVLSSTIQENSAIENIANWAIDNIFMKSDDNRNIVVRIGFRSIVEKAFMLGLIDEAKASCAKPQEKKPLVMLSLDVDALSDGSEEIYPIGHDLAWYVIKRAFTKFLDYISVSSGDTSTAPNEIFLKKYLDTLSIEKLSSYNWTVAAAIAYMKSLGFSRTNGTTWTQASHGSKSKVFSLEEKYTWLAVHYIQGYLSDYLPLKASGKFIDHYMQILNFDNPVSSIVTYPHPEMPDVQDNFIIPEELAPEMSGKGDIQQQIQKAVEQEPVIDFQKWLEFSESDFKTSGDSSKWLSLFNFTSVHDSQSVIYSNIDARGVIVEKGQVPFILDLIQNHPERSYFIQNIDGMVGSPDTDTYSNPSDIVWMKWIAESYSHESYYLPPKGEEKHLLYSITSVTENTVDKGETEIYIPSKLVRDLLGIESMDQELFLDNDGFVKGFNHIIFLPNHDRQEMTLVKRDEFFEKLEELNLEIVWFVELYRTKDALNEEIRGGIHPMKTRKYFVWCDGSGFKFHKIWDERFSNQKDDD